MSPAEIVAATEMVGRSFGPDIAHDVCRIFLEKQPNLRTPIRWWRRTARYLKNDAQDWATARRAPRYRSEVAWMQRRVLTPEQTAQAWEVLDRIPPEIIRTLVAVEGVRGDHTVARTRQQMLRRSAMRYARIAALSILVLVMASPGWAQPRVVGVQSSAGSSCILSWDHQNPESIPVTFTVYWSATSGGAGAKIGALTPTTIAPSYSWTCPATLRSGFVTVTASFESPKSNEAAIPLPPPFGIGAGIQTTAALLNVRATPAIPSVIIGTQSQRAQGTIIGGPVVASGHTWWQIDYAAGPDGWSAEAFLEVR